MPRRKQSENTRLALAKERMRNLRKNEEYKAKEREYDRKRCEARKALRATNRANNVENGINQKVKSKTKRKKKSPIKTQNVKGRKNVSTLKVKLTVGKKAEAKSQAIRITVALPKKRARTEKY